MENQITVAVNPICPVCGLYELNDGSEDTFYTCECEVIVECDKCGVERWGRCTDQGGFVFCKDCMPKDAKRIGDRH